MVGLILIGFAALGLVEARERVSLPYSCAIEQGRLRVERAPDRIYPILGQREQQPYTYCPDGSAARCKTWTVHRFAVSCVGGRVMWSEIVAAAAGREPQQVAVENGQLLLRVGPQFRNSPERDCVDPLRGPLRSPLALQDCQFQGAGGRRPPLRSHVIALPRGYAPLGLIGARVLTDAEPAARVPSPEKSFTIDKLPLVEARPVPERLVPAHRASVKAADVDFSQGSTGPVAAPKHIAQALVSNADDITAPERSVQPKTQQSTVEAFAAIALAPTTAATSALKPDARSTTPVLPTAPAVALTPIIASAATTVVISRPVTASTVERPAPIVSASWVTRIETSVQSAMRSDQVPNGMPTTVHLAFAALLLTVTVAVTALARRRRLTSATWQRTGPGALGRSATDVNDNERAVALRTKSDGHIALITNALERLAAVAPLRNALGRELQSSERRLAVVIAAISVPQGASSDDWTRARRRLERIAQDLDRLQQIADSAVSSVSGLGAKRGLPRDKQEAYATLGVSSTASEAILKKLVEALRISWHPDLAKGDADRALRDARIKEINVAWDLITGKRASE